MTAREAVIKAFPELADPSYQPEDGQTREHHIQSWLKYWSGLDKVIKASAERAA